MTTFVLHGVTASPYQLKMQSLLDFAGHAWERWPQQGNRWSATVLAARLSIAKHRGAVKRFPTMSAKLDEYPAVPFYSEDRRNFYYDSSSLALHLDQHPDRHAVPLLPAEPRLAFLCHLIDEAFDEFGLYMVHHMRWVGSARTTPMGDMTAAELRVLLPPGMSALYARKLCRRQVRRCPYLFSVAPQGYEAGVSAERTPPSRAGFPPTHAILDQAWRHYLAAMEHLLAAQPFLLGQRFTLADASAYGQLSMNLVDGDATRLLEKLAPLTYRWLCDIRDGGHTDSRGDLSLSAALLPLLRIICTTFVPLMEQNEKAYQRALARGETRFNEAAFDQGLALYDGQLLGHPFKSVVKTFQVQVWRSLQERWQSLAAKDQAYLERDFIPGAGQIFAMSTSTGD